MIKNKVGKNVHHIWICGAFRHRMITFCNYGLKNCNYDLTFVIMFWKNLVVPDCVIVKLSSFALPFMSTVSIPANYRLMINGSTHRLQISPCSCRDMIKSKLLLLIWQIKHYFLKPSTPKTCNQTTIDDEAEIIIYVVLLSQTKPYWHYFSKRAFHFGRSISTKTSSSRCYRCSAGGKEAISHYPTGSRAFFWWIC